MNNLIILGYLKKGLLNQRDTGTNQHYLLNLLVNKNDKKRVVSTLFLYLFIFVGCDFKSPEQWETPTWYLPLTFPLIDTEYSFEGIAQDSTIVQDTTNNTINITFSSDIVEEGGARPGIDTSIFSFEIDGTEQTDLLNEPPITIDAQPTTSLPDESELPDPIPLPLIVIAPAVMGLTQIQGGCLPYDSLTSFSFDTTITIPILAPFAPILDEIVFMEEPLIKSLHKITVNSGELGVSIDNSLPFEVTEFSFRYSSIEYENKDVTLRGATWENIQVNQQIQNSDIEITAESKVQFGDSLKIWMYMEIDKSQLTPHSGVCSGLLSGQDGWAYPSSLAEAIFSIDFAVLIRENSVENFICTTNPIIFQDTIITEFPDIDKIDIKGGRITEEFSSIPGDEINYLELVASNSLFAPTTIEIAFNNFYGIVNDVTMPIILGGEMSTTGLDTTFADTLASKFLGVPGEPDSIMKSISIGVKVQINEMINGPISLGKEYSLSISKLLMSKIRLAYLTAVTHELGFDTPSSNIDAVPQGGIGLQFYDVQLILDIYTQIGVPIQLNMELKGKKGKDSVMTLINPELNVPPINITGDSVRTVITLNKDGQKVEWYNMGNIDGEVPDSIIIMPINCKNSSIVDVMNFAPEIIEFGGGAAINGTGFLAPNSYLWGSFKLIAPMAFIFEEPINIIPAEPTSMSPMDPSSSEQIDSSLVEAALNVIITNSSPLGGNLSLLISDSTIFPLFIDSLITGDWSAQLYPDTWKTIWDTLKMEIDSVHCIQTDLSECSLNDTIEVLEVKFFQDDSLQFFIGKMFELGFPRSDSIEYHLGYANPEFPGIYESNLVIDKTRMDWIITDQQRYNISMITFDSSPIQSMTMSGCDDSYSYTPLTFQTTNFIGVQAYLTLTLNTGGLGREHNSSVNRRGGN